MPKKKPSTGRSKKSSAKKAKPAGKGAKKAPSRAVQRPELPTKKRVVVVYKHLDDPSSEQRESLHQALKHLRKVDIIGEIPGSLHLDVDLEEENPLRHAVDQLPDWDLSEEGHARMPRQSLEEGHGHER
jgi:hypothetical protein